MEREGATYAYELLLSTTVVLTWLFMHFADNVALVLFLDQSLQIHNRVELFILALVLVRAHHTLHAR